MLVVKEVVNHLVHIALVRLFLEAHAVKKLVLDDEARCGEYVQIEAKHLDPKPDGLSAARWRHRLPVLVLIAGDLRVEDRTLVGEGGNRFVAASGELPNAVSVLNLHFL